MKKTVLILMILNFSIKMYASKLLIPMDVSQKNHLRAYGLTFWVLGNGLKGRWLLNYRGGAFILPDLPAVRRRSIILGVTYIPISDNDYMRIKNKIKNSNMNNLLLEKAPRIAVYAPKSNEPWDDAVTLVLTYAKIKYKKIYDAEVLQGSLSQYDWLHVHHEDFTGQYGKFHRIYGRVPWYIRRMKRFKKAAVKAGFKTVAAHKLAVAKSIQRYVADGGFLFAMCSAPETLDIALASDGLDIIAPEIDGTPVTRNCQNKLNFLKTFAFQKFKIIINPDIYSHSNIDIDVVKAGIAYKPGTFDLFQFSAKIDPLPTMLVQNHVNTVKGFLGQTTAFRRNIVKSGITLLGYTPNTERVKYIHGTLGKGSFSFLGGHDPEDYRHHVGDPPTNLDVYPNSPGYRLILNNVLFPSAEKKKRKT
ncbi:MAG: asparagine synthetase B [Spirochaetes bacterium]|nr:asparagine synthetase B [Spirochaetota bacterium]